MTGGYVAIQLLLEHQDGVIRAQTWIKGKVVLSDNKAQHRGSEIEVGLVGKERVSTRSSSKHNGIHLFGGGKTRWIENEHTIFEECVLLNDTHGSYSAEQGTDHHEYPFSIYLPKHLPPSLTFVDDTVEYSIEYKVSVKIRGILRISRTLSVVGASFSSKRYPFMAKPRNFPVKDLHVGKHHQDIIMGAKVANTHVWKGGVLDFSVCFLNRSQMKVKHVEVELVEKMHCENGEKKHDRIVLLKKKSDFRFKELSQDVEMGDPQEKGFEHAQTHLSAMKHTESIHIPNFSRDSVSGGLIKVSHVLKISLITEIKRSDQRPSIEIPLRVFDPPINTKTAPASSQIHLREVASTNWPSRDDDRHFTDHHIARPVSCSSITEDKNV